LPLGHTLIMTKWLYCIKLIQMVAQLGSKLASWHKGSNNVPIGCDKTFPPIAKYSIVCILPILADNWHWNVIHHDVKITYLNSNIHKLQGYIVKVKETKVCIVNKGLYRLKQSGCYWYKDIDDTIIRFELKHSHVDTNVYYFYYNKKKSILLLHTNDIYLLGNHTQKLQSIFQHLKSTYKMIHLGELTIAWN
jgi:hypothetical protein